MHSSLHFPWTEMLPRRNPHTLTAWPGQNNKQRPRQPQCSAAPHSGPAADGSPPVVACAHGEGGGPQGRQGSWPEWGEAPSARMGGGAGMSLLLHPATT